MPYLYPLRVYCVYSRFSQTMRFFVFTICCVATISSASAMETIRIGWVYAMANTPVLVAYHNGFFTQAGVEVKLRRFNSGPLLKRALEAGDLDMGYVGMPPAYQAIAEGADIKIVAKVNYGQAALITAKNSPIKTLADLKGKKIAGVREGSGMDVLLKSFVLKEAAKLDASNDVNILHMPSKMMVASVNMNVVDAAFTWEPFISFAVLTGRADVLFDMNKEVPRYPWYVIVANHKMRTQNRNAMQKILKAHKRAIAYLNAHTNAGDDLIIEKFKIGSTLHAAHSQVNARDIVLAARGRLGWDENFTNKDELFLQRLMNYSHELGFINKELLVNEVIDRATINWMRGQF